MSSAVSSVAAVQANQSQAPTEGGGFLEGASEFVGSLPSIKNTAQSLLAVGPWFAKGTRGVVQLIPADTSATIGWLDKIIEFLKPFETVFAGVKALGNTLELVEKGNGMRKHLVKEFKPGPDQNVWKALYRITSTAYIAIDTFVLIPLKYNLWNLLEIGGWGAKVGLTATGLGFVRDGLTVVASCINVRAEVINIDKAEKRISDYGYAQRKESLDKIKETLAPLVAKVKTQELTDAEREELKKIKEMTAKHWATSFKRQKDKEAVRKGLEEAIPLLEQELKILKAQKAAEIPELAEKLKAEKKLQGAQTELARFKADPATDAAALQAAEVIVATTTKESQDAKKALADMLEKDPQIKKKIEELNNKQKELNIKREKLERMKVFGGDVTSDAECLNRLQQVVVYKLDKNEYVNEPERNLIRRLKWTIAYDIFKACVVTFTNLIVIGVAIALGPAAPIVGALFIIGQWITGVGCGLAGLGRVVTTFIEGRAKADWKTRVPTTQLLKA